MTNRARDIFHECLAEGQARDETLNRDLDDYFKGVQEGLQPFFHAVQKFADTGKASDILNLDVKQVNDIGSEEENAGAKRRGNRKKVNAVEERATEENVKENIPAIKIKKEKISETPSSENSDVSVNSNASNLMPAPSWKPKKPVKEKKTEPAPIRSTRSKTRKVDKSQERSSVVVVENNHTEIISLSDTEDSDQERNQIKKLPTRSTRTKTRKQAPVPESGSETETENTKKANKNDTVVIKTEPVEEVRSTRTKTLRKGKKAKEEESDESQTELRTTKTRKKEVNKPAAKDEQLTDIESTRSTRTKTRKQAETEKQPEDKPVSEKPIPTSKSKKRESDSPEVGSPDKKTKSDTPLCDTTTHTLYEDAQSTLEPQERPVLNTTVVINKSSQPVPIEPQVANHPKYNIFDKKSNTDMFTDDESSIDAHTPPAKAPTHKKTKEVFSPYQKTTLKKKVEAFEKLQSNSENSNKIPVKIKPPFGTPLGMKFMPTSSSTSNINRLLSQRTGSVNSTSFVTTSAQKDPQGAVKKKNALLQAQAEARRKQNEEKHMKAQQQRKALEAERLKQLEIQKEKEERYKKRELEREEHLLKQKQEQEQKKLAHKKKIEEIQAQRQQLRADHVKSSPPKYMVTEPPKLPTADCYDSDDPEYKQSSPVVVSWTRGEQSKLMQLTMLSAGETIKNTLFYRQPQTPDLREIFGTIDPRKLKRTSSMFWKAPPRYTMMPDLSETKFSEDSCSD